MKAFRKIDITKVFHLITEAIISNAPVKKIAIRKPLGFSNNQEVTKTTGI